MNRKKVAALLAIVAVSAFLVILRTGDPGRGKGYILDRNHEIPVDAVKNLRKKVGEPTPSALKIERTHGHPQGKDAQAQEPALDIDGFLSGGLIHHETLRYLRFLHAKFRKSIDTSEHLEEIHGHLFSTLPEDEAGEMFRLYSDYLACEMDLMAMTQQWTKPQNADDYLDLLRRMQDFRREHLGDDVADTLFGAEVKSREYAIRRAVIVHDDGMLGREKEALIGALTTDLWGEDGTAIEQIARPYNRYREKLAIYARDFDDMTSDTEKSALTREFRKAFFPAQVVARLEAVDGMLAREKTMEAEYTFMEREIRDNPELTPKETSENIDALQNDAFGDAAGAFRRREAIEKGLARLKARGDRT